MNKKFKLIENYDVVNLEPTFSAQKSFYGKAKVKTYNSTVILVSYDTEIVQLRNNNNTIKMLCNAEKLSMTTLKHLREFLRQFGHEGIAELTKKEMIKELY